MDIEEFISNVLVQLNSALKTASGTTDKEYEVDITKGINFDLAVTTSTQDSSQSDKKSVFLRLWTLV